MSTNPNIMPAPELKPPVSERGIIGWIYTNLFSSRFNTGLTVVFGVTLGLVAWFGLRWLILDADWTVIATLGGQMVIGQYNIEAACPWEELLLEAAGLFAAGDNAPGNGLGDNRRRAG